MAKKKQQSFAEAIAHTCIESFDREVHGISLEEYAQVLDIVGAHIDGCIEAVKDDLKNRDG